MDERYNFLLLLLHDPQESWKHPDFMGMNEITTHCPWLSNIEVYIIEDNIKDLGFRSCRYKGIN